MWEKEKEIKGQEAMKTDKQQNGIRQANGRPRPKETNPDSALQQGLVRERRVRRGPPVIEEV